MFYLIDTLLQNVCAQVMLSCSGIRVLYLLGLICLYNLTKLTNQVTVSLVGRQTL